MFNKNLIKNKNYLPFDNINFLDVGCGGGLLSESLTRLGGNVTAIDPSENSINEAQKH